MEGEGLWCFIPLLSVGCTSMPTIRVGFTSDISLLPMYLLNGKLCYAQGGNCSQSQHMGPISGSIPASSDVQGTWLGFQGLACQKSSSKHPHSHTGNPGKSRDVLGRCCQPLTLLSLTDTENQLTWDDCFLPDILISAFITEQDT